MVPALPDRMIEGAIEGVRRALERELAGLSEIDGAARVALAGGKHLRARLVLLVAAVSGEVPESALRRATFIELLHAGALCHDDVLDRCLVRRGQATVEARFGTRCAALVGINLLARAARTLASEDHRLRRTVARALREVARGQTDELFDRFDGGVLPTEYLRRAYAKTGALYEIAAALGADGVLSPAESAAVRALGAELGVAFQLADDVLDLVGGDVLQREPGTDLRRGVFTHPVLATLSDAHRGGEELRRSLCRPWEDASRRRCTEILRTNGALDDTIALVARLARDASGRLEALPSGAARDQLDVFITELVGLERLSRAHLADGPSEQPVAFVRDASREVMGTPDERLEPVHPCLVGGELTGANRAREAACRERFRSNLPQSVDAPVWVDRVAAAGVLGCSVLGLAAEIENVPKSGGSVDDRTSELRWMRNAARLATIDLQVADLFALSALVPARVARTLAEQLASLCTGLARALERPAGAMHFWPASLHDFADAIAAASREELRGAPARHSVARAF